MPTSSSESLQALGRLLANENSASDLLTLLAELDDRPLSMAFGLPNEHRYSIRREVAAGNGRLDVVIDDIETGLPRAVIEMKGATDLHGDQLERYLKWANDVEPNPQLFLCAFDRDEEASNPAWTRCTLREVFSPWIESEHPHASWLANEIVVLLDSWDAEADGELGIRTGYYVPDIVTKRLAREVNARIQNRYDNHARAAAYRDNGGSPMIVAWAPHPRDPSDNTVVIGVDLRSPTRRSTTTKWKIRPHIQVGTTSGRRLSEARGLAFDLAWDIHAAMGYTNISEELEKRGLIKASKALSVRRFDGFNKLVSDFDFQSWAEGIDETASYPRSGVFFHDKGRRLATIIDVDVAELSRHELADMVLSIVEILHASARELLAAK